MNFISDSSSGEEDHSDEYYENLYEYQQTCDTLDGISNKIDDLIGALSFRKVNDFIYCPNPIPPELSAFINDNLRALVETLYELVSMIPKLAKHNLGYGYLLGHVEYIYRWSDIKSLATNLREEENTQRQRVAWLATEAVSLAKVYVNRMEREWNELHHKQ